jgi:hypothetical protein
MDKEEHRAILLKPDQFVKQQIAGSWPISTEVSRPGRVRKHRTPAVSRRWALVAFASIHDDRVRIALVRT